MVAIATSLQLVVQLVVVTIRDSSWWPMLQGLAVAVCTVQIWLLGGEAVEVRPAYG